MTHTLFGYDAVHAPGRAALWERSPRGLLELHGTDRVTFLQGMVSNDVAGLALSETCHAALLDSTGHILADLRVHMFPESLIIETDAECFADLYGTLDKFLIMEDVMLADVSHQWRIVSLLGNGADSLPEIPGERRLLAFPLAAGYDLWLPADINLPEALASLPRLSADAAETLRVEAGLPAWGKELSPAVLLPEAEMADAVSYTKGCYVGQEIVARLHARGHTNRALRRLLLAEDAPVPPAGTSLHVPEDGPEPGREIGRLTSAVRSPKFGGRTLALGYVRKEYLASGTPVTVQIAQPGGAVFEYHAEVQEL